MHTCANQGSPDWLIHRPSFRSFGHRLCESKLKVVLGESALRRVRLYNLT